MKTPTKAQLLLSSLISGMLWLSGSICMAAPPVRIAIIPGGGSGMEQSIVDSLTSNLQSNSNIVISTVNPDWFVVCNILEQPDSVNGTVKVNGTVTIKTTDGQVVNTVAVQTNKSDFSLTPGAPLNKALVESAVREVIAGISQRAITPIDDAVNIEIAVRDKIISAESLAAKDDYSQAIAILSEIGPDTPHFKAVLKRIADFQIEKEALLLINKAEIQVKHRQYLHAIRSLSDVNPKSKRYKLARQRIAEYKAILSHSHKLAKVKAATPAKTANSSVDTQVQALEAQKQALQAQQKAIEAQQNALKKGK